MSEVKRWDHHVTWGKCATMMALRDNGKYVLASDYAALEADRDRLKTIADNYCAVPDGYALVPVEPTSEMLLAAEEAHMPFGDMEIALRMAMLAAPAPVQAEPATYKAMLSAATSAANATEFSQFLSAVMDAAGLVRHGRRSKELSEYLGRMCMQYRLSAVGKEPVQAEPASPWVAVSERIEEAFQFGFNAPVTYNDVLENDVAEAWEKERSYLLRPLPPAPEVV